MPLLVGGDILAACQHPALSLSSVSHVLCVLGNLLGNRTFSARLLDALGRSGVDHASIDFDYLDYARYPANRAVRLSGPLEVMSVFEKKWRDVRPMKPTSMIVNGWELAVVASAQFPDVPVAVALDTTPALMHGQTVGLASSRSRRALSAAANIVYSRKFYRLAKSVEVWLPMSSWCRSSLETQYGVEPSRSLVTLSPQPFVPPISKARRKGVVRGLFVGNDFVRKGGDLLVELLREAEGDWFELTIVSNDPEAVLLSEGSGAKVIQGIRNPADIIPFYQEADVLLFPSRRDQFGHVVAEAMVCGAVPIVSLVGGVADLVRDGVTGIVQPANATKSSWNAILRNFAEDHTMLNTMSEAARGFARQNLSLNRFDELVAEVLGRLNSRCPISSTSPP